MAMTVKQRQWQLYFLGFFPPELEFRQAVDGIWGPKSWAATLKFQQTFFDDKIARDGIFGTSTANKSVDVVDAIQDVVSRYAPQPLDKRYWGLAGTKTTEATKAYQQAMGLPTTGIADAATRDVLMAEIPSLPDREPVPEQDTPAEESTATGTFWDGIVYFKRKEMRCKCGGKYCSGYPAEPQQLLMELADRARKHFGRPAHVVSGLRCQTWNRLQGGVANSQHMYGEALDIRIEGVTADKLLAFFLKQPEVRYAYKINATNVHFDIPKGKR